MIESDNTETEHYGYGSNPAGKCFNFPKHTTHWHTNLLHTIHNIISNENSIDPSIKLMA